MFSNNVQRALITSIFSGIRKIATLHFSQNEIWIARSLGRTACSVNLYLLSYTRVGILRSGCSFVHVSGFGARFCVEIRFIGRTRVRDYSASHIST
jgi:hypothetical protein